METRVDAHTKFYVSGWRITAPQSACRLFDIFIWFVGGVFRLLVIGVPAAALLLTALYLGCSGWSTPPALAAATDTTTPDGPHR